MFLVIIDSHSKWIKVFATKSATNAATIRYLHQLIAQFWIPETIISDNSINGTQFVANEFKEFYQLNGIRYVQTICYRTYLQSVLYKYLSRQSASSQPVPSMIKFLEYCFNIE